MRNLFAFPFLFCLLALSALTITGCGDDDDGGPAITLEALQGKSWGLTAQSNTGVGRGAEIAALFTQQELDDNGYDSASELAIELDFFFALFSAQPQPCETNNTLTFLEGGALEYNYSDDCTGNIGTSLFDEDDTYSYTLSTQDLIISGGFGDVIRYTVRTLNDTTMELVLSGDVLFSGLEFDFAASNQIDLEFVFVYTAQ